MIKHISLLAGILFCIPMLGNAQIYTGHNKAKISLASPQQTLEYESNSVTSYLNLNSGSINFYAKAYTFVMDKAESSEKTLLINALQMNNDNASVMEFKAQLPRNFTVPTAGQSKKISVNGEMQLAGVRKSIQLPVEVRSDKNGNLSYTASAVIDLNQWNGQLSTDVKNQTSGLLQLELTNAPIHLINYR